MNLLNVALAAAALGLALAIAACNNNVTAAAGTQPKAVPGTMPGSFAVTKTDAEWKKELTPEQYATLREKGTERAFTGKYDDFFEKGTYVCAACGTELFTSDTKFNSGCGWPAFYAAKAGDKVSLVPDSTFGMERVEVICTHCGGHLGHIFDDAPDTPTGQRFCINSVSLKFIPAKDAKDGGAGTMPAEKK